MLSAIARRSFHTEQGRRAFRSMVLFAVTSIPIVPMSINLYLGNKVFKWFYELKEHGKRIQLPDWLERMAFAEYYKSGCHQQLEVHRPYSFSAKVLAADNTDPVVLGSSNGVMQSNVGLPIYMFCATPDQVRERVERGQVKLRGLGRLSPEQLDGKLVSALLLSDRAKRFVIQREMQLGRSFNCFGESLVHITLWGAAAGVCYLLNGTFGLLKRPLALRLGIYTSAFTISTRLFASFRYWGTHSEHLKADKITTQFGRDYAIGALEYFEKTRDRNLLARKLLGQDGERFYTETGEYRESGVVWTRGYPNLRERAERIRSLLKMADSGQKIEHLHWHVDTATTAPVRKESGAMAGLRFRAESINFPGIESIAEYESNNKYQK